MNYLAYIVRIVDSRKNLKEWLIIFAAMIMFSMLAYRIAFYPESSLAPLLFTFIIMTLTVWKPVIGLAIYLIAYPLVPASGGIDIYKGGILALTVILLFIWWNSKIKTDKKSWLMPEFRWLFLLFLYLCLSPLLGFKYDFTITDWARDIAPLFNLLLIPLITDHLKDSRNRWLLYLVFVPIALGMIRDALFLLSGYGFLGARVLLYFPVRLSTYHPSMIFGLGLVLFIQKAPRRWWWLAFSILGAGITFLSPTRTIWLSLGFMVGLLLIFFSQHRKKAIALMVLVLVTMGIFMFKGGLGTYDESQQNRYQLMLGYKSDASVNSRLDELYQTIDLFKSSPILGVGFGYQYHFWRIWVTAYKGSGYFDTNYTHNDITNFAAKGGLVGLILFWLMLHGFIRQLGRRRDSIKEPVAQALAVVAIIAIYQSLFVGLSTPVYQSREALFLFSVLIAMGLGYKRAATDEQ